MKFDIRRIADISTAYLAPGDLKLISDENCPMHVGEVDGHYGSFFYVPLEDLAIRLIEAEEFGLSARFCRIIRELAAQAIPYARFDADGGDIDGLEPLKH